MHRKKISGAEKLIRGRQVSFQDYGPGFGHPCRLLSFNQPRLHHTNYESPIGVLRRRLIKSAAPKVVPFLYFTNMSNSWSFRAQRASRPTEALSASRYFKAVWSVSRVTKGPLGYLKEGCGGPRLPTTLPGIHAQWWCIAAVPYPRSCYLKQTGRSDPSGWI